MLKRWFGSFGRGSKRSSYEVLKRLVPGRELQKLALATPDRRHLFEVAAAMQGISELELMRKIASQLGLAVIERPAPMELELLSGCTVAELRAAAVVGITGQAGLIGCICLDPEGVEQLPAPIRSLPRHMSSWSGIARALDESERALQVKLAERSRRQDRETREIVEGVLGIVIADTLQFGASRLEIDCSQAEPVYRFRAADGKTGTAALNAKLHGALKRYCEELRDSGAEGSIQLPNGVRYHFQVRATIVHGVFLVAGQPEVGVGEVAVEEERIVQPEAPVLHSIDGGKAERKVVPLKTEPAGSGAKKLNKEKVRRPKVLVVDDNEVFANVLERFLGRMEIDVVYRSDGGAVVTQLADLRADLLICDVHMPGTPGFEVVKMVRAAEQYRDLPIVMLTSDTDIETEVRLLNSGADAFVSKSEDPRVLCAHVHRLLVRAGKRKEAA